MSNDELIYEAIDMIDDLYNIADNATLTDEYLETFNEVAKNVNSLIRALTNLADKL